MYLADIPKIQITTPFGLFEFTKMPFGMHNSGNTIQLLMDWTLLGLDLAFMYLNNIFIYSRGEEQHRCHLTEVLNHLKDSGLTMNREKYEFRKANMDFLGHKVTTSGIIPLLDRVETIKQHSHPYKNEEL